MASAVVTKQIQRSSNMLLHGNNIKLLRVPTVSCCYSTSRSICSAPSRFLSKTNNDGHNLGTKQSTSTIRPESVNLLAYQQQGLLQEDQQHVQRQLTIPIMMKAMPSFLPHKGITQPPFKFSNDSMSLILSKWQHGFITSKESLINSARRMLTSGGPSKKKSKLKKKSSNTKGSESDNLLDNASPSVKIVKDGKSQHTTWVDFQKSIAVDGFETGQQVTTDGVFGGGQYNRRGGKQLRRKKEKERLLKEAKSDPVVGGGHFPPLSYSKEETERLLEEAYAGIPERAGPRRSRHLKREKRRGMVRRKYAKSVKRQRIATHFRRMETRSKQVHECKAVRDNAPDIRERDRLYQLSVLTRWVQDYYAQSSDDKKIKMLEEGADKKIYPE